MSEKHINTIIRHLHGTQQQWEGFSSFIPLKGELVIYDTDNNYDYIRLKVGDGQTLLSGLPFLNESISDADIDQICSGEVN